jgi:hypothetical protein
MDKPIYNPGDAAKDAAEASVLAAASNLSGGMDAARQWYFHQAIAELDGLTPAQAVAAGRSGDVRRYIEMLEAARTGWADYDAGRLSDFDPADIKARGRGRLASRVRDL